MEERLVLENGVLSVPKLAEALGKRPEKRVLPNSRTVVQAHSPEVELGSVVPEEVVREALKKVAAGRVAAEAARPPVVGI